MATAINYTVEVTNTGSRAGDEVVLAFFKPVRIAGVDARDAKKLSSIHNLGPSPLKQLFAFERVHLPPGASTTLHFSVSPSQLSLVGLNGHHMLIDESEYEVIFTRGHGVELSAKVAVKVDARVHVVSRFRKWWK